MYYLRNVNIFHVDTQLYQDDWKLVKREIVRKHEPRVPTLHIYNK